MKASNVYVRFYRSFNYDYLRKTHPNSEPHLWDVRSDGTFYPFVRVGLDPSITTVVGGNEAGKSQLLFAVKAALTGHGIERKDFCRYSQFFTIDREMARPEFGIQFSQLSNDERATVSTLAGLENDVGIRDFAVFRFSDEAPQIFVSTQDDGWSAAGHVEPDGLGKVLPRWFEIDSATPLPDSVPIRFLTDSSVSLPRAVRRRRILVADFFDQNADGWSSPEQIGSRATELHQALDASTEDEPPQAASGRHFDRMLDLADDLLVTVAGVDRSTFAELHESVRAGNEGFANGIIDQINRRLAAALNFKRHWSQDHHFALLVSLRDFDLVFTIRDRTGTEYSFSERSGGLKYFLSYFVQYLAHRPPPDGAQEILLMDEPDAYLSSSGQQDLLRIFEAFAHPEDDRAPCQVVYVTHSPFMIDKNHGERIRVLEKGEGDEGTRVVSNAARNHYEPLRSAFGSFVAETTFISNCNVMLEGPSDQVLLAGMAAIGRRNGAPRTESLDLNTVTLVPAGSASQIPYLVYLARGRDVDRPAVIVLLDSDKAGDDARRALVKSGKKARLDERYVLQVGDLPTDAVTSPNPNGVRVIEDLVPVDVALAAAERYVNEFLGADEAQSVSKIKSSTITIGEQGVLAAIERRVAEVLADGSFHLDKVGFARSVVALVRDSPSRFSRSIAAMDQNFRVLFRALAERQRAANRELDTERASTKINRLRDGFFRDHPTGATREQAYLLLEEINNATGEGPDAEHLAIEMTRIKREHQLDDLSLTVEDFAEFQDDVHALAYAPVRASQADG